jgi:hypothetical protein
VRMDVTLSDREGVTMNLVQPNHATAFSSRREDPVPAHRQRSVETGRYR